MNILTVVVIQVGSQTITKYLPQQCVEVGEVASKVVRVTVRWDQGDWTCQSMPPQSILDVWDCQFVNHRMQETPPADAQVFLVNMRIMSEHVASLMSISGTGGKYIVEPRSNNGRQPNNTCIKLFGFPASRSNEESLRNKLPRCS